MRPPTAYRSLLAGALAAAATGALVSGAGTLRAQGATASSQTIYALQALIDFDTLDGAQFDPATRTVVLAGRMARADRVTMIAYLDHLATAMEVTAPTLSLEWLPGARQELDRARNNPNFLEARTATGGLTPFGLWLFQLGGADVKPGLSYVQAGTQLMEKGGFRKAFGNKGLLHLPPALVPLTFDAAPAARSIVKGMPADSLLAHVALEADVATKSLIEMPELAATVPGYVPYSQWEQSHGEVPGSQRMETRPARFEVLESADGRTMRFGQTQMRFTIEQVIGNQSKPAASLTAYAAELTRRFDALSVEVPILHHLRECLKIIAVAQWAKRHGWPIALPSQGRVHEPVPSVVPGVVHLTLTIDMPTESRLALRSTIWEAGGVDLRFDNDTSVVTVGPLQPYPVVRPVLEANDQLRRIAAHKIDVPLPDIPGWVAHAGGGEQALRYVAVQAGAAAKCQDPAGVNQQLELVRRKATILEGYDNMINAQTRSRVAALSELQRLSESADRKRTEMYWFLASKATSLSSALGRLQTEYEAIRGMPMPPPSKLPGYISDLKQLKGVLDDVKTASERKERSDEYWRAVAKRLAEYVVAVEQDVRETRLDTWFTSRYVGAKVNLTVTLTFMLHSYAMKLIEIQTMLTETRTLDEQMRTQAVDSRTIQANRQRYDDEYRRERATLDAMMKACPPAS